VGTRPSPGRRFGLVLSDMAALQDEFADGKQEQEDKNRVEFGGEESVDHEQFSLSPACSVFMSIPSRQAFARVLA
jgi:hypothetical protein